VLLIGLQRSARDLHRAGLGAIGGGGLHVLPMTGLGAALGHLLGWRPIDGLFVDAVISDSSSTMLCALATGRDNPLDERALGLGRARGFLILIPPVGS
jgi:Kef-type K+ transport system membrane component KefB